MISYLTQSAILFLVLFFVPWLGDVQGEARLAFAGGVALLTSGILFLLWDILNAPMRLQQAAESQVSLLTRQLELDADVEAMKDEMLTFCREGRRILGEGEITHEGIDSWKERALVPLRQNFDTNFVYSFEEESGYISR